MNFELIPVLKSMASLFKMPANKGRFEIYLSMLQGSSSDDMELPITSYNPMGKSHVLEKIETLISMDAEQLAAKTLEIINDSLTGNSNKTIRVVLNVSDDLGGAWSHRFETDHSSKFNIRPLVKRNFCTPHFWTSEEYYESLVSRRTREYAYRTWYWLDNGAPKTLAEHLEQELFVLGKSGFDEERLSPSEYLLVDKFYRKHRDSQDYNLIFNFFYGDEASSQLGYSLYGLPARAGIRYLNHLR